MSSTQYKASIFNLTHLRICLTNGSSRSLRSLGTAFRGPLTKRYASKTLAL